MPQVLAFSATPALERKVVMAFVIQNSTGGPLPQDAMRSIVEAVDTWRGQNVAFVVFRDQPPYEIVSVHATDDAARTAATAGSGLNYFGPVAPRSQARSYVKILKTTGCGLRPVAASVSKIVLRDADDVDVEQLTVNDGSTLPDRESDIEAIFLTVSGIDKFMIPYLTRVFGAEYAAAKRKEWIQE
jgi:hypothetical protein